MPDEPKKPSLFALGVAALALVAFGVFTFAMVGRVDVAEPQWTRLAWLFSSVEAIAFAAAGAIFGSSVQRDRAVSAEGRAADAESRAKTAEQDAAKGATLGEAVKAALPERPLTPSEVETLGVRAESGRAPAAQPDASLAHLQRLAARLYPE